MNGFTFFASYYDAIKELPEEEQSIMYVAIMRYIFDDVEPELCGTMKLIFTVMRPNLDTSKNRSNKGKAGRKKSTKKIKSKSIKNQSEIKSESMASEDKDKEKKRKEKDTPPISPLVDEWFFPNRGNVANTQSFLRTQTYKYSEYIRGHPKVWDAIKEWMAYKDGAGKARARYQAVSIPKLLTEIVSKCEELGEEQAIKAIDMSIGRGYIGITWDLVGRNNTRDVLEGIT